MIWCAVCFISDLGNVWLSTKCSILIEWLIGRCLFWDKVLMYLTGESIDERTICLALNPTYYITPFLTTPFRLEGSSNTKTPTTPNKQIVRYQGMRGEGRFPRCLECKCSKNLSHEPIRNALHESPFTVHSKTSELLCGKVTADAFLPSGSSASQAYWTYLKV